MGLKPYILKIDTTWGWREDVQIKAGKIYGVYLVDKGNTQFNEYHLIWLYNEVEKIGNYHTDSEDPDYNEDDEELLNDIEFCNGGDTETDEYTKDLSDLDIIKQYKISAAEMESAGHDNYDDIVDSCVSDKDYYKDFIEYLREYYLGNRSI